MWWPPTIPVFLLACSDNSEPRGTRILRIAVGNLKPAQMATRRSMPVLHLSRKRRFWPSEPTVQLSSPRKTVRMGQTVPLVLPALQALRPGKAQAMRTKPSMRAVRTESVMWAVLAMLAVLLRRRHAFWQIPA